MIRRSPCELYIKYLLLHPEELDTDALRQRLVAEQLDHISLEYLEALREVTLPPVPFHPFELHHNASQRFLAKHGVRKLFHPDAHVKVAKQILKHAKAKEFVESMILSDAPIVAIAKMVAARFHIACSQRCIEMYKVFFWNTDLVDSTEMRALLALRINPLAQGLTVTPSTGVTAKALRDAAFTDPRRVAANMPSSPMAALLSQMRMGFMPAGLEVGKVLEVVQALTSLRLLESVATGSFHDSSKAVEWSIVLKNVTDVMETVVTPEAGLREQLSSLLLKTDGGSVPLLHELTEGKHTVEMQPMQDEHGTESEAAIDE